jgi:hypothetical protein
MFYLSFGVTIDGFVHCTSHRVPFVQFEPCGLDQILPFHYSPNRLVRKSFSFRRSLESACRRSPHAMFLSTRTTPVSRCTSFAFLLISTR